MDWNLQDDELLRSYLLGKLPDEEADRLEGRLIEEDGLFDLCEAVEADLLAAYARGELTAADGERVQLYLASYPGGRERLALARSLNTVAGDRSESRPVRAAVVPFWRRAPAHPWFEARWPALATAAALLAVVGGLWFAVQRIQETGAPPRVANEISTPAHRPPSVVPVKPTAPVAKAPVGKEPRTEPDRLAQRNESSAPAPAPPEPVKALITLSLATVRGAEDVEEFRIPAGAQLVEIQIDLEGLEDHEPFRAAVRGQGNQKVWEKGGLAPKRLEWGTALVLEIPAERLPSGRYEVVVTARSEELTKDFEVIREAR